MSRIGPSALRARLALLSPSPSAVATANPTLFPAES